MKQGKQFYEFGPFRIEEHERLLRRGQEVVALPPKAAELLLALFERHGEAVRKEELLDVVWRGTFVEENSLAQNVYLLRKALGDHPGTHYIDTIPRRGYRFVAPVRTIREDHGRPRSLAVLPREDFPRDRPSDPWIRRRRAQSHDGSRLAQR
jgi:DNA-binding winged helix-turn-helix (wHTH) protein